MSWTNKISVLISLLLLSAVSTLYAQDGPRPTPTNIPGASQDDGVDRGTIQGAVYQDMNGDGRCVGTGIGGEEPVEGVAIEFVSSDEATVITLYTGANGAYGLAAAGQSYWAVTAKPSAEWIVTSEATLYAPIFADSQAQTGINFCVQKTSGNARVRAILPAAGGSASPGLTLAAITGLSLILIGLFLNWREKRQHS